MTTNSALTESGVLPALEQYAAAVAARQIHDAAHPDDGGVVRADWGVADPGHTTTTPFVSATVLLHAARARGLAPLAAVPPAELLARAGRAIDYMLRAQRPSGLIDLQDCNYDSAPDTAFAVQSLCAAVEIGRPHARTDAAFAALLERIERFVRRAVPGIISGGFHTPNHRWVIASALAQAGALMPDLDVRAAIDAYLAEGFDIDAEGAYLERSSAIYDSVCDRSLLLLADHLDCPSARPAVIRNLEFDLHLLHADGTMETGLSRRQDYGTAVVPLGLAAAYAHAAAVTGEPRFGAAARWLWARGGEGRPGSAAWMAYVLLKFGDAAFADAALPADFARLYPLNGLWRARRGALSASFFRGGTRLLNLRFGQAELSSLKISAEYFGTAGGWFVADHLDAREDGIVLRSDGRGRPRRPGYELPLGRPVPPDQYETRIAERGLRVLPPLASTLEIREAQGGFDLHYRTLAGLDGVLVQAAFDFPPGGIWETGDSAIQPRAGQAIFLKSGLGAMRYGDDVIAIGPGADAHRMWAMRDAEPAPNHVRVLAGFRTPVDHMFTIRTARGARPPAR